MSLDVSIGERIRGFRGAAGHSVEELAYAIGVPCEDLRAFETGAQRISAKMLFRVSKVLNLEVRWFFDRDIKDSPSLDCATAQETQFKGEYPAILRNLRLNKTLEELCESAKRAETAEYKSKKVA